MKDAKIYDGAGWQSLKGPPGPSAVSADADNIASIGGDGLVFVPKPPENFGEWSPESETGDLPEGIWSRTSSAVTLILNCEYSGTSGDFITGLPFSAAFWLFSSAPVFSGVSNPEQVGVAYVLTSTQGIRVVFTSPCSNLAWFTLTYLTGDP